METVTRDISRAITQLTERFSIIQTIYSSQIHEVLLLHDHLLDRRIVGKRLKNEFDSDQNRQRLLLEFKQIIELSHPNIIRGYDLYCDHTAYLYTLEYIEEQFDCDAIGGYVNQILRVFKYLHRKGIVHRDIKENNFLYRGDQLYLIDFSMAKRGTPKEIEGEVLTLGRYLIGWLNQKLNISIVDQPRGAKKVINREIINLLIDIFKGKQKRL